MFAVTDSPSAPAENFLQFKRFDQDCPGVGQGIITSCYTVAQKDAVVNFSHQLQIDALSYSCTWHQQGINHIFFIKWNKGPDPNSSGNDNLLWLRLWALEVNSSYKDCGLPIIVRQLPGVAIFYEILYGWQIKQYCFLSPSEAGTYGRTDRQTDRQTDTHTHTYCIYTHPHRHEHTPTHTYYIIDQVPANVSSMDTLGHVSVEVCTYSQDNVWVGTHTEHCGIIAATSCFTLNAIFRQLMFELVFIWFMTHRVECWNRLTVLLQLRCGKQYELDHPMEMDRTFQGHCPQQ